MSDKNSDNGSDNDEKNDKPIVPQTYNSTTQDDTVQDILASYVITRPPIKIQFIKKRNQFGLGFKFSESDANDRTQEVKHTVDQLQHQKKRTIEIGIQGSNMNEDICTQTTWNIKLNRAIQTQMELQYQEVEDDNPEILQFLQNVYPFMEEALQSNETIDVFQNDLNVLGLESDFQTTTELSTNIKELKSCSICTQELNCRGKIISHIQFQPENKYGMHIVANSFVENFSFEERTTASFQSYNFGILLWDYQDIHSIDPILVLQSSLEILCFDFNPTDPTIIAAGTINGQIFLYDIKKEIQLVYQRKNQKSKQEKNQTIYVKPYITSTLQDPSSSSAQSSETVKRNVSSHKNPVTSLCWLPSTIEFDKRSFFNFHHHPNGTETHQFVSLSESGQILFWDTRFNEKDSKRSNDQQITWKANYGMQLFRPEGAGQMSGYQLCFQKNSSKPEITGTSDDGEVFVVDWTVRPNEDVNRPDPVIDFHTYSKNYRAPVGLDRSVFFQDIILSIHDFCFCIWKEGVSVPIFQSYNYKNCMITCGGFSPFRPGVIIIGRNDGQIDVWDFVDQSHKETMTHSIVACGISSLRFNQDMPNIISFGDCDGMLHIIDLPYNFYKQSSMEKENMQEFWDREVKRVEYVEKRFNLREEQTKAERQEREKREQQDQNKFDQSKAEVAFQFQDSLRAYEQELDKEYQEFVQQYFVENIEQDETKNPDEKRILSGAAR